MPIMLPEPLPRYFEATSTHDVDEMLTAFAQDAIVHDEGETHVGRSAIGAWIEDTTHRYGYVADPIGVAESTDGLEVTARLTGAFPGSPVELQYTFVLADDLIAELNIR